MSIEYEARILEIDPISIEKQIISCGGKRIRESLMRRYMYAVDQTDRNQFIRLRDTGFEVTLTHKKISHDGIDGTEETEIVVNSFEKTHELLSKLGYKSKWFFENHRISFELAGARLEIDKWPLIPAYLEIEADSQEQVIQVTSILGYSEEQLIGENTLKIYAKYGVDLNQMKVLRFSDF